MRILFLTHTFNSLAQRLWIELGTRGHELSLELDIHDAVTEEAVALHRPDVIVAPFLKRRIPESVWRRVRCLVVHPGIRGDRGPSALDWAIQEGEREWGATVLEANGEMDAGDIWSWRTFPMRAATKSSLYRNEVTEAAVQCVLEALEKIASHRRPEPLDYRAPGVHGRQRPPMRQADRAIDWQRDDTCMVLAKIRAADGSPGVLDDVLGLPVYLHDAHPEATAPAASPGEIVARREGAILRATIDGAVWIGHLRVHAATPTLKLPAADVLGARLARVPEWPIDLHAATLERAAAVVLGARLARVPDWPIELHAGMPALERPATETPGGLASFPGRPVELRAAPSETLRGGRLRARGSLAIEPRAALSAETFAVPSAETLAAPSAETLAVPSAGTWRDLWYEESGAVGYVHFPFHNGAMSARQSARLADAIRYAKRRPIRVIVLMGGADFWSNGIHLNSIEASGHPADASWESINAIDDVALEILTADEQMAIAALQGNAGAGGVFLALAADRVLARASVVLNAHYKGMGNLYGSEYWTYLLPKRVGAERARTVTENRLPIGARQGAELGLVDACVPGDHAAFASFVRAEAEAIASRPDFARLLEDKRRRRAADEAAKPLARYRAEELERMKLNFYGFDPSYHVARYHFVFKVPRSRTPLYLARHRGAQRPLRAVVAQEVAA